MSLKIKKDIPFYAIKDDLDQKIVDSMHFCKLNGATLPSGKKIPEDGLWIGTWGHVIELSNYGSWDDKKGFVIREGHTIGWLKDQLFTFAPSLSEALELFERTEQIYTLISELIKLAEKLEKDRKKLLSNNQLTLVLILYSIILAILLFITNIEA